MSATSGVVNIWYDDAADLVYQTATDVSGAGSVERMRLYSSGDVRLGTGSALATTATVGFLLVSGCAGTPTGNPANDSAGSIALVYDTTNNLLYANDGGGWVAVNSP